MVTICTTSLSFNNSTFCLQSVFMRFVYISEQRGFILSTALKHHTYISPFLSFILKLGNKNVSEFTLKSMKFSVHAD